MKKALPAKLLLALTLPLISCAVLLHSFSSTTKKTEHEVTSLSALEEYASSLDLSASNNEIEHKRNLINIRLTGFLEQRPEYVEEIIKKFPTYSPILKQAFLNALVYVKGETVMSQLGDHKLRPIPNLLTIKDVSDIYLISLDKHDAGIISKNLDYLSEAFQATKKEAYLFDIGIYYMDEPKAMRDMADKAINLNNIINRGYCNKHKISPGNYLRPFIQELSRLDKEYSMNRLINLFKVLDTYYRFAPGGSNQDVRMGALLRQLREKGELYFVLHGKSKGYSTEKK